MGVEREGSFGKTKIVSEYVIRGTGGEARTKKGCSKWSLDGQEKGTSRAGKKAAPVGLMMHDGARLVNDQASDYDADTCYTQIDEEMSV